MRTRGILLVLAVWVAAAGCSNSDFLAISFQNLTLLPIQAGDEVRMKCRNRQRAEEAWQLISMGAKKEYSPDYAAGFKAGYADYLNIGGNGDPPAVPPFCYRTVHYQTPEGIEAINQWYEGWKHGALMAKASGLRELEIVPLSAPPINAVERYGSPIVLPSTPDKLPVLPAPQALPPTAPQK
jgi:hypothetical protein